MRDTKRVEGRCGEGEKGPFGRIVAEKTVTLAKKRGESSLILKNGVIVVWGTSSEKKGA